MKAALAALCLTLGATAGVQDAPAPSVLRSVSDLVEVGFGRSRVVMMNEGHDWPRRCPRTRLVGLLVLPRAHALGVRDFALEALTPELAAQANRTRRVPDTDDVFLSQSDMRALIRAALDLGWTLHAYESDGEPADPAGSLEGIVGVNWREVEQARKLAAVVDGLRTEARLLVWCGNSHLSKRSGQAPDGEFFPMAVKFQELTRIEPFSIDQVSRSVAFSERSSARARPWIERWRAELEEESSGTLGFLCEDLEETRGEESVDAYVVSLFNELR